MEQDKPSSHEGKNKNPGWYTLDRLRREAEKDPTILDIEARRPRSWFNRKPRRSSVPNAHGKIFTEPGYKPGFTYGVFDEHDIPDKSFIKYSKTLANLKPTYDDPVLKREVFSRDMESLKDASCQEDLGFNQFYYDQFKETLIMDKVFEQLRIALLKNNYLIGRSFCAYISPVKNRLQREHPWTKDLKGWEE